MLNVQICEYKNLYYFACLQMIFSPTLLNCFYVTAAVREDGSKRYFNTPKYVTFLTQLFRCVQTFSICIMGSWIYFSYANEQMKLYRTASLPFFKQKHMVVYWKYSEKNVSYTWRIPDDWIGQPTDFHIIVAMVDADNVTCSVSWLLSCLEWHSIVMIFREFG